MDGLKEAHWLRQWVVHRSKAEFFEKEIKGISFTYQTNPSVLTLSETGAEILGISRFISEPLKNQDICGNNESLKYLSEKIAGSSKSNPDINIEGYIFVNGEKKKCRYNCRTLWREADNSVYVGTVGTVVLNETAININ